MGGVHVAARWNLRDFGASSLWPWSGPPLSPASQKRLIESAIRHLPESKIRLIEQDSVPNGGGRRVRLPIWLQQDFSTIDNMTSGHGIEGDARYGPFMRHRYLARSNPKAPNLRADPPQPERTIRCAPDFRIRSAPPAISARTSLGSGSISKASPGHVAPAWRPEIHDLSYV